MENPARPDSRTGRLAMGKDMATALVIHGHFYQPPRENPWTGAIQREPGAHPYHNWNERILRECYGANAFARVVDQYGRVSRIVNNYASISFNFGPTLHSWIEKEHPRVAERIAEADRISRRRRSGHGNALAQAYNHAILPLCSARDRRTQIRWGLEDFRYRYGRDAESMWLPETACNDDTLGDLIDAGLKYVILSPHQAQRVRDPSGAWEDVSDGSVDTGIAYEYFHRDGSGRSIALFFYDAGIARSIAFGGALSSSQALVDLLSRAAGGEGRIVHAATDGESYGHHTHFADRSLAYALEREAVERGFWVTNYGEYLERYPPAREVEVKPGPDGEGTAWSCSHGVGRWCRDCGCQTGGQEGWNQAWRGPVRAALDHLRDCAAEIFETEGGTYYEDPWAVRDDYVRLFLDHGSLHPDDFLREHSRRRLRVSEHVRALTLLEIQRNSLLMYTSCGWFFSDISGIETLQVLKYAGRVLDLIEESGGVSPKDEFLDILSQAKSNIPSYMNGADIYQRFVRPCAVSRRGIAAHLAFSSIVETAEDRGETCEYSYEIRDFRKRYHGRLTLGTGRVCLESIRTGKQLDAIFAVIHFGGIDFYCLVKPFPGADRFHKATRSLWKSFRTDSLPRVLRIAQEQFGPDEYGLEHVLPEGRKAISEIVFGNLLERFSQEYARLYEENRRTLEMLQSAGFDLPPELRVAAEFTLGSRFGAEIRQQNGSLDPEDYRRAVEIAQEATEHGYDICCEGTQRLFRDMIADSVSELIKAPEPERIRTTLELIEVSRKLCKRGPVDRAQELLYEARRQIPDSPERAELIAALDLVPSIFEEDAEPPEESEGDGRESGDVEHAAVR